jgi:Protein of unknown function (DUF2934)
MSTNISPESGGGDLPADVHEAIRQRAEQIYERSGKIPGRDIENWTQAEREIRHEAAQRVGRRTAVVVKVDGIDYLGEYALAEADGYTPGEFSAGDPLAVRFEENKMYVKRANGKELETRIVKTYD